MSRLHVYGFVTLLLACPMLHADSGQNVAAPYDEPPLAWQLNQAAASSDRETLVHLLASGVSADAVIPDTGMTALMVANDAETARLLIRVGARHDRVDGQGWRALHYAATRVGGGPVAAVLVEAGADPSVPTPEGQTPLLLAGLLFTEAIDPETGTFLIRYLVREGGADINAADVHGWTLLHRAASNDSADLARVVLGLGADPDRLTVLGESPRQLAVRLDAGKFLAVLQDRTHEPE
ncbi:MAG: ankyrin repeat domain-containing protein [Pseudomonadota bacterium]